MSEGFDELCRREPRLRSLEEEVQSVRDDGGPGFFCSNFIWLPVNGRLRGLLGVARIPCPGDEAQSELYDSRAYELAFGHLSRLLPACRACGCRSFQPLRDAQVG